LKRIAILIATTGGPVLVDRITVEAAPQSMVCLKRQSDVLPISADYDDFVRAGSGVIMREFGPYEESAFRLDVSDPIGTGLSWQLGFFAAHAVFKSDGAELSDLENADLILWLTGTVDYDLKVGSVDHVFEKVEASALMLATWIGKGTPIIFGTSPKNALFLDEHKPPAGIEVKSLETTVDLLNILDLNSKASKTPEEIVPPRNALSFWFMSGLALCAVIAIFVFTSTKDRPALNLALDLELTSDRGQEPIYHFGDDLTLIITVNKTAWLHCFYQQVDNSVLQIYPNPQLSKNKQAKPFIKDVRHVLSGANNTPFVIRLGPPAGKEEVTCFASDENITPRLPVSLRGSVSGPLSQKLASTYKEKFKSLRDVDFSIKHLKITLKP